MTPEKRNKIKALMNSPSSTENEKLICRKLLKDNPEKVPEFRTLGGDFWQQVMNQQQAAAQAQQAALRQSAVARGQAAQGQQGDYCGILNSLFGGIW